MTGDPIPAPTFLSLWAEFGDGTLTRWAIRSPLHQLHYVTNPVGSALGNLAEAACLTSLIAVLHGIMRGVEQTHILVTSGGGEMFMLFLRECRKALYRVYKQYNYKALRKVIAFLQ